MTKVVLVHGNGGATGSDNWFPSVKAALEADGIECLAPDMPDPMLARSEYWLPYLKELGVDADTVVVGHSSGAVAAMRYAETHRLKGSVLVGACYTDLGDEDEKRSGYYDAPWDWETIKKNQAWIAVFASDDDPYISIDEPRHIKSHLDAEYLEYSGRGHFMTGDVNEKDFPELVEFLLKKLQP